MNFLSLRALSLGIALLSCVSSGYAQTKAPVSRTPAPKSKPKVAPQAAFKLDALPIAALPQVPVEFEFVGTQKDLLGLVQSVARGVTVAGAAPASPNMSKPVQIVSDADVLAMLRDVQFLRAQSFNFLKMEQQQDAARRATQKSFAAMTPQELQESTHPTRPQRIDVQEFYGKTFRAQKGQRQFFSRSGDADGDSGRETTISVWAFEAPRSWALVTQGPSRAIVVRSNGLPNLEVLGRVFRMAVSRN